MVNIEQLQKDASLALAGAEYVREKLSALAGMGPQSLYDQVYAIKLRIKSTESLSQKVIEKRQNKENPKPNYSAADATDLVGMRLLSLYASDLPAITRSLVAFLKFCQTPQIAIIDGSTLESAVREIVVYKSRQSDSSRIYEKIYRYFRGLGFDKAHSGEESKLSIVDFDEDVKSYSSVHIVVDALSYAGGHSKIIPVEIQIRSIFEDTWGEIDHGLEYKFKQLVTGEIPEEINPVYQDNKKRLRMLKDTLEDVGSSAELIRSGYNYIFERVNVTDSSEVKSTLQLSPVFMSDNFEEEVEFPSNTIVKRNFEKDLVASKQIRIFIDAEIKDAHQAEEIILKINDYIHIAKSRYDEIKNNKRIKNEELLNNLIYFYKMEESLCLCWVFKISDHFFKSSIDTNLNYIDTAIDNYLALEKNVEFRDDAFLNFRLGSALVMKGTTEVGEFFLDRALELMPGHRRVIGSVFSAILPHKMSYVTWLRRSSLLQLSFRNDNPHINRESQIEIVGEALYWALHADHQMRGVSEAQRPSVKRLRRDISNNIIALFWELRDFSSDIFDFRHNISYLVEMLNENDVRLDDFDLSFHGRIVEEADKSDSEYMMYLDTLLKYNHMMGKMDKVLLISNEMRDMLASGGMPGILSNVPEEIYLYSLDRVEKKGGSYAVAEDLIF